MPVGGEDKARVFYGKLLGLVGVAQVLRPASKAKSSKAWRLPVGGYFFIMDKR